MVYSTKLIGQLGCQYILRKMTQFIHAIWQDIWILKQMEKRIERNMYISNAIFLKLQDLCQSFWI